MLGLHFAKVVVEDSVRQLIFHFVLAPAQQERPKPAVQFVQVLVSLRTAPLIEFVKFAVKPEERSEDLRIQELNDRINFVNSVLQRRSGQDKGMGRDLRLVKEGLKSDHYIT